MNKTIKSQFPIFTTNPDLVYLDSAASALTPQIVIDKMNEYYTEYGVNIHRGLYTLSDKATQQYEAVRAKVAGFLNAESEEIVFTSGTTQGLNMLARSIGKTLGAGDNVVLTGYEHHANLIPWQEAAKQYRFELRIIPVSDQGLVISDQIDAATKVVSVVHVSNSIGEVLPVEAVIAKAKEVGAMTIIDAAQSIVHQKIDVKKLDCDFLAFSGHKLYGPTGAGVLYGKKATFETLDPAVYGGDMVSEVNYERASWTDIPHRFEAGTPHIAGVIGLGAAIDFIKGIGFETIRAYESKVTEYLITKLTGLPQVTIIGSSEAAQHAGIVSFTIDGIHPHDIAEICNRHGVAVRAGHHCTMPLMSALGIQGTVRVSLGIYNAEADVDALTKALEDAINIFS